MLYIQKTDNYLTILNNNEVEDFVVINFGEYFKSTKEKLYSKLNEKQNLRKVAESLYIFLTTCITLFMHQSIMTKIKHYASEDWVVIETVVKHSINILEY